MTDHEQYDGRESALSRRRFIAAAGVAAGAGVAGCTEEQDTLEFEAQPIHLPEEDREELVLAETGTDSHEETREPEGVDGEVTITSHVAAYRRGPARGQPTLIEKYLGGVNGTEGAGAASVAAASDLGVDEVTLDLEGADYAPLSGNNVSIVAPAGLRDGEAGPIGSGPMVLAGMDDETQIPWPSADYVVDAKEFFPGLVYDLGRKYDPMTQWMPAGDWPAPDNFLEEGTVLVALGGQSPEEVFGVPAEEMPGEPVEEGESFRPYNPFIVAAPGEVALDEEAPSIDGVIENGTPAWVGGATFGQGVVSTPRAEVGGEARNPFATEDLGTLLGPDRGSFTRDVLSGVLGIDGEDVEWLAGPEEVSIGIPTSGVLILDEETELETFAGVVSGENGPWFVGLHAARVEHEGDAVIAVGGQRTPAGEADSVEWAPSDNHAGAKMTAACGERLAPSDNHAGAI